jgi:putative ABC transport system permease protein
MSGMSASFREEIRRTIDDVGADSWVLAEGASGPTTGFTAIPADLAAEVERQPGVEEADPLVFITQTATVDGSPDTINVFAHEPDALGSPDVVEGRAAQESREIVVDRRLGARVGDTITVAGQPLEVVGETSGHSMFGGIPNAYVPLSDVQQLVFGGEPLASTIAVAGDLDQLEGFKVMTNDQVQDDSLRTMGDAIESVDTTRAMMWAVAAVIVAGLMFVSALERIRDFAVLKAMGASSGYLFASIALQAVAVALLAAVIAAGLSKLMTPLFALPVAVPGRAFLVLPIIALVVGLLSSLAGLRRAVSADPALAFS